MFRRVLSFEPRLCECFFAVTEQGLVLIQERPNGMERIAFRHRCNLRIPRCSSSVALRTSEESVPGNDGFGRAKNGIIVDVQMRQPGFQLRRGGQSLFGNWDRHENRSFIKVRQLCVLWLLKGMHVAAKMNKKCRPKGEAHDTECVVKVRA